MSDEKEKHWKFIVSILTTIAIALSGYLYTWNQSRSDAQYSAQLNRVNKQLKEFYGPLYTLVEADNLSFQYFVENTRPDVKIVYWSPDSPPNDEQKKAWRRWFMEVTIPGYLKMEKIIINHSDLLIEDDIPQPILDLSAHISGYKPVVANWKEGDFSRNSSFFNFPQDVRAYLRDSYKKLKLRQKYLLGIVEGGPNKQMQQTDEAAAD